VVRALLTAPDPPRLLEPPTCRTLRSLPGIDIGQLFIVIFVLLLSLTIHEMAHAWTADRLGDPTARRLGRVSINPLVHIDPIGTVVFPVLAYISGLPLIGWAKPVPVRVANLHHHRRDYVLVAAAGPASNLVLATIASMALRTMAISASGTDSLEGPALLTTLAMRMIEVNVLLAVFNMVPIPPLDGGNVLGGLLPDGLAATFDAVRPYGFLLIYALMFTGILVNFIAPPYYLLLSWLR
jgi:Zn-dependent protease